jgi:hypothetical protein
MDFELSPRRRNSSAQSLTDVENCLPLRSRWPTSYNVVDETPVGRRRTDCVECYATRMAPVVLTVMRQCCRCDPKRELYFLGASDLTDALTRALLVMPVDQALPIEQCLEADDSFRTELTDQLRRILYEWTDGDHLQQHLALIDV